MATQTQTMDNPHSQGSMLRTVILADAVYCDVVGLALLLFNGRIGAWVGLPPLAVAITGALLMLWALDLFIFGRRDPLPGWLPYVVIGGNIAWVLFTIVALVAGFLPLTIAGGLAGNELVRPTAVVILGGLITSTLLILVLLPSLYLRFGRRPTPEEELAPAAAQLGAVP